MLEKEYKFLLSKNDFYNLYVTFSNKYINSVKEHKIQINYYYDTSSLSFHNQHVTVRIRQDDSGLIGQFKKHHLCSTLSEESTFNVDVLPRTMFVNACELELQGELVTKRDSIIVSDDLRLDFDTNYYLGFNDFELEIEYSKNNTRKLKEVLQLMKDYEHCKNGKSTRFFQKRSCNNAIELGVEYE